MITLPNYDDQSFNNIMEAARRRIPVLAPQWTDLNEHDPGITILELFAWLKEMQQYQLNRITAAGYESMLNLLGTSVRGPVPARGRIAFSGIVREMCIPEGMRFEAPGGVIFECEAQTNLNGFSIQSVCVNDSSGLQNVTAIINEPGIYCHAFGQKPAEGESALYIGMDRLEEKLETRLFLLLEDGYGVKRNPFEKNSLMPRDVVWEYGAENGNALEFKPVELIGDETYSFSQSGEIVFRTGGVALQASLENITQRCCWLRARLTRMGCEENPRLVGIYKDTVPAIQKETFCETASFTLKEPGNEALLELYGWIALTGEHIVFVRDIYGWKLHNEFSMQLKGKGKKDTAVVKLSGLPRELALDGGENVRVVCYTREFGGSMILPGSNGLSCQRFPFQCTDAILPEQLSIAVYEEVEEECKRWTEWKYVPRLSKAGPYDCCFTYDRLNGEIVFGDNEQGAVPMAGKNNIMIVSCAATKGSMGNIPQQKLQAFDYKGSRLEPVNLLPAEGGTDEESLEDAIDRFKVSMKQCMKAVSREDYELLAAATPGLRIMGVRALPFFDPESKTAGDKQAPATVTVVALPYSEEAFPMPDSRFLLSITNYLENYRLITTKVKATGPVYIKISVYAEIVLEDGVRKEIEEDIRAAAAEHFTALRKGVPDGKPAFGEPVRESFLAMRIGAVPGIAYVKKVTLGVRNGDSYRDKYGNIVIPPHGLAYMGELQIHTFI